MELINTFKISLDRLGSEDVQLNRSNDTGGGQKMKWELLSYVVYLVLLCVTVVYTGVMVFNPVVMGALCSIVAGLLTVLTTMLADHFDVDWYFD